MAAGTVGFVLLLGYAHQLALGQAGFLHGRRLRERDPVRAPQVGSARWPCWSASSLSMALAWAIARADPEAARLRAGHGVARAASHPHRGGAGGVPFTGGALGTYGVPKFALFGLLARAAISPIYYVVWAIVFVVRRSIGPRHRPLAHRPRAQGDRRQRDRGAARSASISCATRCRCSCSAAGMASVCGSLGVHYLRAMDPNVFGFAFSLNFITAVIIGGLMSVWGGALGAARHHRPARAAARPLAAALGRRDHGRAHGGGADRLSARGFAGFLGASTTDCAGARGTGARSVREPDTAALPPIAAADRPSSEVDGRRALLRQSARREQRQLYASRPARSPR